MELSDFLKIGVVNEVQGKTVRAGIYNDKNTEYLNYNGSLLKNVGIGSFVLIRKGFNNIIGKVEGESIKEFQGEDKEYSKKGGNIKRIISISILGGMKGNRFIHGLTDLPLIGNFVYILEESVISKIFSFNSPQDTVRLGKIIGYDDYPFEIGIQEIVCSHVGIFGNTGSGKSNTLAKIYREIIDKYKNNQAFKNNSHFLILDFNGEYGDVFAGADKYVLSTKKSIAEDENINLNTGEIYKYTIEDEDMQNQDFWSIILEATEKTQKPFINRTIKLYKRIREKQEVFSLDKLCDLILRTQPKYQELKFTINDVFRAFNLNEKFDNFENIYHYNGIGKTFYKNCSNYNIDAEMIKQDIFDEAELNVDYVYELPEFEKFEFALKYNYWLEISRSYITKEHISPLISRAHTRCEELSKIFEVLPRVDYKNKLKV